MSEGTFVLDGAEHDRGDPACEQCWKGWPQPCEMENCDGQVHAEFGDENADCEYWLILECDTCGERP
jgi:hypothetical protein